MVLIKANITSMALKMSQHLRDFLDSQHMVSDYLPLQATIKEIKAKRTQNLQFYTPV